MSMNEGSMDGAKPGGGIEGGRWTWGGQGKVVGKQRQLYWNINKKRKKKDSW